MQPLLGSISNIRLHLSAPPPVGTGTGGQGLRSENSVRIHRSRIGPAAIEVGGRAFGLVLKYHITKFFTGLGECQAPTIALSPRLHFYQEGLSFLWMLPAS